MKCKETFSKISTFSAHHSFGGVPSETRLCVLSVSGFETRITQQLINRVLHPDKATATLKRQSQTRLRNVTTGRQHGGDESTFEHAHVQLRNMIFGFLSRRRNKNCRRYGQQMVSFRQKHVELRKTEVMNKTVHQSSMNFCPNVFVISLTPETHVLFETMMFQQIVFSFRKTARVTLS